PLFRRHASGAAGSRLKGPASGEVSLFHASPLFSREPSVDPLSSRPSIRPESGTMRRGETTRGRRRRVPEPGSPRGASHHGSVTFQNHRSSKGGHRMFARLTLLEGPPERYDDAVRTIREQALPGLREIPG